MKEITLGTLFDGIGGFPYAALFYGIRPVWASEVCRQPYRSQNGIFQKWSM